MPTKQIILIVLLATVLPSFTAVGYVYSLSSAERWLFMMRADAQRYAEAMLAGDAATQGRYAKEFKGEVVVANPKTKTVLFAPRGDSGKFTLLYAPNETADWISYEQTGARRIREKWYVLAQ
ncbi:MAG: hypothetical protein FD134_2912 [Gallionellaceae bacterium]|nr:MAG: hypothetical protein FD134_2912 [Gallionellaceae bacterium]